LPARQSRRGSGGWMKQARRSPGWRRWSIDIARICRNGELWFGQCGCVTLRGSTDRRRTMPPPFLEIVELADGTVALRRPDEEGRPLLVIEFSEEARDFLQGNYVEVAKAMINTGMQMAGQIMEEDPDLELDEHRVLH